MKSNFFRCNHSSVIGNRPAGAIPTRGQEPCSCVCWRRGFIAGHLLPLLAQPRSFLLAREVGWPGLAGAGGQSPLHLVRVELENHSPAYDRAVFRLSSSSPNVEGTWWPGNAGCPLPWAGTVKAAPWGGGGCLWAGSPCALVRVSLPGRCARPPLPMSPVEGFVQCCPCQPPAPSDSAPMPGPSSLHWLHK